MRYCNIADPPVYTEEIERWDRETDADGEAMGGVIEQLLNNDHYAREAINRLLGEPVYVTFLAAEWKSTELTTRPSGSSLQASALQRTAA